MEFFLSCFLLGGVRSGSQYCEGVLSLLSNEALESLSSRAFFFSALLFGDRITRFHGDGERWVEQPHNNALTNVGFFPPSESSPMLMKCNKPKTKPAWQNEHE